MGYTFGKFGSSPTKVLAKCFNIVADDALGKNLTIGVLKLDRVASIELTPGSDTPGRQ